MTGTDSRDGSDLLQTLKRTLYSLYKRVGHLPPAVTAAHFFYQRLSPLFRPERRSCRYRRRKIAAPRRPAPRVQSVKELKIAFVCDEMTFQNFAPECRAYFVTPRNWLEVFETEQPDLFFCESAWSGIDAFPDCWRGRIYRSDSILFENRRDLLNILDYCRANGIPTAFWNKEDPTFFGNAQYDFVDTALRFDYLFTTARECVGRYRELGHPHVETLMFGFSPHLFFPGAEPQNPRLAVFAGSWYADQPERCRDMEQVFETVLSAGLELVIYDRQSSSTNPVHRFPARYTPYLRPALPFGRLGDEIRKARFAVNINTVRDSDTMFARRVFELMACNLIVVSNESKALRELFPGRIWFAGEPFDLSRAEEICEQNRQEVFTLHTCEKRLGQIAETAGLLKKALP